MQKSITIETWRDGILTDTRTVLETVQAARARILAELDQIDAKSIRPAREGNATRLAVLEAAAADLRAQLAAL
jgi:hypothetical protein